MTKNALAGKRATLTPDGFKWLRTGKWKEPSAIKLVNLLQIGDRGWVKGTEPGDLLVVAFDKAPGTKVVIHKRHILLADKNPWEGHDIGEFVG